MIRLRRTLERAQKRRWLWLILIVFFAIMLALVALHSTGDATAIDGPLVCMAVILLVTIATRVAQPQTVPIARRVRTRGPPPPPLPQQRPLRPVLAIFTPPLRL